MPLLTLHFDYSFDFYERAIFNGQHVFQNMWSYWIVANWIFIILSKSVTEVKVVIKYCYLCEGIFLFIIMLQGRSQYFKWVGWDMCTAPGHTMYYIGPCTQAYHICCLNSEYRWISCGIWLKISQYFLSRASVLYILEFEWHE